MTDIVTTEVAAGTRAEVRFKVTGAPLTTHHVPDLSVMPEEVHLLAWFFEEKDSAVLTWRINLANVKGRWLANDGELSDTRTELTFVRPLGEYADDAPQWLKDLCTRWLAQLNTLVKEG